MKFCFWLCSVQRHVKRSKRGCFFSEKHSEGSRTLYFVVFHYLGSSPQFSQPHETSRTVRSKRSPTTRRRAAAPWHPTRPPTERARIGGVHKTLKTTPNHPKPRTTGLRTLTLVVSQRDHYPDNRAHRGCIRTASVERGEWP